MLPGVWWLWRNDCGGVDGGIFGKESSCDFVEDGCGDLAAVEAVFGVVDDDDA